MAVLWYVRVPCHGPNTTPTVLATLLQTPGAQILASQRLSSQMLFQLTAHDMRHLTSGQVSMETPEAGLCLREPCHTCPGHQKLGSHIKSIVSRYLFTPAKLPMGLFQSAVGFDVQFELSSLIDGMLLVACLPNVSMVKAYSLE